MRDGEEEDTRKERWQWDSHKVGLERVTKTSDSSGFEKLYSSEHSNWKSQNRSLFLNQLQSQAIKKRDASCQKLE
jgi:hypothetical protein